MVLNTGDPVTMTKWIDTTPALLDMWYGGQEGGHALAAILFGDANPSGKLPVTLPKRYEDNPAAANYPGKDLEVNYAEGIYVGYRYYDTKNVEPQFPFGFGLSYTKFEYSDLKVQSGMKIQEPGAPVPSLPLNVRNTGSRAGAEVVELYVHDGHAKIDRPSPRVEGLSARRTAAGRDKDSRVQARSRGTVLLGPGDKSMAGRSRDIRNSSRSEFARHPAQIKSRVSRSNPSTQLPRRLVRLNSQHIGKNSALFRAERILIARGVEHRLALIWRHRAQVLERAFHHGLAIGGQRGPAPCRILHLRALLRRQALQILSARKTPFALRFGHLVDTVQLLHKPLLLACRQPVEARIVVQHPLLFLGGNAAMRIEPSAQVAGRSIRSACDPDKPDAHTPGLDRLCRDWRGAWPLEGLPGMARRLPPCGPALRYCGLP